MDPFTNPDELFDVCDPSGRPTGRVKRRADVHRDGDWHRAFHCWILCRLDTAPDEPALLLQRRGAGKDTWPLRLDVSVGGHFAAGETLEEVLREVEEEVGVRVHADALIPLGRRLAVSEPEPGLRDREIQEIYLWRASLPLTTFHPQPVEVTALEAVSVADLLALLSGQRETAPARTLWPGGTITAGVVRAAEFIPTTDRYFYRAAIVADLALRGYPHLAI